MIDINNGDDLDFDSARQIGSTLRPGNPLNELELMAARLARYSHSRLLAEYGYDISLTNPVAFLRARYPGRPIFRYIQSHPDLDHMRGLAALRSEGSEVVNFWDTVHDKAPDFQWDSDEQDWKEYSAYREARMGATVLRINRGVRNQFYNQDPDGVGDGDGLYILSPTPEITRVATESENTNNLSYVLWFQYRGIRVVLGGDAEDEVWDSVVGHYGNGLKCHVLKASHHGRDSGYHQRAVELMNPEYTVVSVGKKPENDASNKYRQYGGHVWSTRWRGTISLRIDDQGGATISSEYDR